MGRVSAFCICGCGTDTGREWSGLWQGEVLLLLLRLSDDLLVSLYAVCLYDTTICSANKMNDFFTWQYNPFSLVKILLDIW